MRVYDIPTVGVEAAPMVKASAPEVRNLAAEQGQEMGAAMTDAGVAITKIGREIQDDIDTAAAKEADNKLADAIRTSLYDPENGYLQKAGKAALAARPDVAKSFQESVRQIEGSLMNDMQRYMFKRTSQARMQSALLQVDGHAANQAKVYSTAEAKARFDGARRDALANWAGWEDPGGLFQQNKKLMLSEIDAVANLLGIPKDSEQYEELVQASTTQLHSDVLTQMLSLGQTAQAKKYFDAHVQEIQPDKLDEVRRILKTATTANDADALASKVWAELAPRDRNGAIPLFRMTERVRELAGDNEDVQKAAVAGIKERAGEWNAEQIEYKAQNIATVWGLVDAGKPYRNSEAWLLLTDLERHQISTQIEQEAATRLSRAAAKTQKEILELERSERLAFLTHGDEYLTATDPTVLRSMSRPQVEALRTKFGMTATQHLLEKWDLLRDPKRFGEAKMDADDFTNLALAMGMDPYSKEKKARQKVGALRFHVEQAIDIEQLQRQKPMTRKEKTDFIKQEMAKQVLVGGLWTDRKTPALALSPEQWDRVVVPPQVAEEISEAMARVYKRTQDPMYAPLRKNLIREYLKTIAPGAAANFEEIE